jgi:hypothetical protein
MDTDSQQHDLVKHVLDAGFPLNATSLIHLFVGGSQLHGAKVSGYDDLDIYGCYIEPPERILGVLPLEHYVWSSGSATEKNTADDVDVTTYSLHRWGELIRRAIRRFCIIFLQRMSSRRPEHGRDSLVPIVNN